MTIFRPMPFQTLIRITDVIAHAGSEVHAGPRTPNQDRTQLNRPMFGSNTHIQTSAIATVAVMWGMKTAVRYQARARRFVFSSTAITTAIAMATGTVNNV